MQSTQKPAVGPCRPQMLPPLMEYHSRPVSVAVDPVALVISECAKITSAFQKYARPSHSSVAAILGGSNPSLNSLRSPSRTANERVKASAGNAPVRRSQDDALASRWGLRGQKGRSMQDNPIISGFGKLRHDISAIKDFSAFDPLDLMEPFLQVLQAKGTAAPVTILTLGTLRKFLAYGFIPPTSPRFVFAMQSLAAAITRCHFDGSDAGHIEVVLSMILHLMEDMMLGPAGSILSDENVCEMMGRGLAICSQPRFSPVLRRTAEGSLARMCQIIFEDIKHLEVSAGDSTEILYEKPSTNMGTVRIDTYPNGTGSSGRGSPADKEERRSGDSKGQMGLKEVPGPRDNMDDALVEGQSGNRSFVGQEGHQDAVVTIPAATESGVQADSAGEPPLGPVQSPDSRGLAASASPVTGGSTNDRDGAAEADVPDAPPHSLPSAWELFRVLINFLDPHDHQHTDTMKIVSLRILHVALEVAGPVIARHQSVATLLEDRLCCYLLQLVRSDNMTLLEESLAVTGTLLATCRGVLKLQQELYLSYLVACLHPLVDIPEEPGIHPSLYAGIPRAPKLVKPPPSQAGSGRSTPVPVKDRQKLGLEGGSRRPDARQAMVESIGVLARIPTFMAELFVNYDCDEDRADLCEDMVGLLARNALPDSATWSTTSVPPLCLDALLRYVHSIAERLGDTDEETAGTHEGPSMPHPAILRERRQRKKVIVKGTSKFNQDPRAGLEYLFNEGIVAGAENPESVAVFLRGTSRVSKKVLGEFLSKKGNEAVLEAYMSRFDFSSKRVDEALRAVLETFRLPGEAPLISRIVSAFSEAYINSGTTAAGAADKDAVFILTYAIILLNTDQHNPNVKQQRRMKLDDFARNLKGQNAGQDFAPDYLAGIYNSIKANEIVLPDEHDNKHAFDYAWRELLSKAETAGTLVSCDTNRYDCDMFAATWRPIVSTLSYVFMSASDDTVFTRIVAGFDECARIAVRYQITDALDHIVYCLSHMTTISTDTLFSTKLNTEVQAGADSCVMVSELAVKLGRNVRAQLATLVLFRVVTGSEAVIQKGWAHIVRIWLNLFVNSLIPPPFLPLASPTPGQSVASLPISPIPLHTPSQVVDRGAGSTDAGFFSAFTSYISSYAADDPPEPSDEELESTLCTVDCIGSCHLDDIFGDILVLPPASLVPIVDALLGDIIEDSHISVMALRPELAGGDSARPDTVHTDTVGTEDPEYDPSLVYILEFCTVLACRDGPTAGEISRPVIHALMQLLRKPARFHHLVVARATFYLLNLLRASHEFGYANVPILLHAISSFSRDLLGKASSLVLQGIDLCVEQPGSLRNELMTSPGFWAILHALARNPSTAPAVFGTIERSVTSTPSNILAHNYDAFIGLLAQFASAAQISSEYDTSPLVRTSRGVQGSNSSSSVPSSTVNKSAVTMGVRAIEMVQDMTECVPQLMQRSHLESREAWSAYWLPILRAFTDQCTNPSRDVRSLAFASLQRSLLSPDLISTEATEWTSIFSKVLFPLIFRLLKPEVFSSDREGMGEMRVQSASLLCKVFLQYLVLLSAGDGMLDLWLQIIDIMDRLINSGQGDSLEEPIRENLKNVVLFMSSTGLLVMSAEDEAKQKLWTETWARVDRFLPGLREDLVPENDRSTPLPEHHSGS